MKNDPFGNLTDWGEVLDTLEEMSRNGHLSQCQPGLIRVLRYKGNWRLREEVLKCVGKITSPSKELVHQVIDILDDDNIYYDARMMAGNALIQLLENDRPQSTNDLRGRARKVIDRLKRTPQPVFFNQALHHFHSQLASQGMPGN